MTHVTFSPIAYVHSCFKEKFGIPRQSGLITESAAEIRLTADFNHACIKGLADFSHIWISFIFNATQQHGWKPLVRPPRLGGNKKVGVFASRSPFRPNPLGLSVVELSRIEFDNHSIILHVKGCDLLDMTPVVDIKPYLPYVDAIPDAQGGYANDEPLKNITVIFNQDAKIQCEAAEKRLQTPLFLLIEQVLALDPRPSYHKDTQQHRTYSMKLYDFDLKWQHIDNQTINVMALL